MKRLMALLIALLLYLTVFSAALADSALTIDINISRMNHILTFTTVKSIIDTPAPYVGRRIRVDGYFGQMLNVNTGKFGGSLIVVDMLACCYEDGMIQIGLRFDDETKHVLPQCEQKFTLVGVVESERIGPSDVGVIRVESITLQDHWAEEIKWGY